MHSIITEEAVHESGPRDEEQMGDMNSGGCRKAHDGRAMKIFGVPDFSENSSKGWVIFKHDSATSVHQDGD